MMRWIVVAVAIVSCQTSDAGLWHHRRGCKPYCDPDRDVRVCGCHQFCPRGYCGCEPTGCMRRDYARYVVTGTDDGNLKPIAADYYPEYRVRCRDFWLRDTAPCSCLPH